jgi:hypothetical protein
MQDSLLISPDAMYTEGAVALALDVSTATLRRARVGSGTCVRDTAC